MSWPKGRSPICLHPGRFQPRAPKFPSMFQESHSAERRRRPRPVARARRTEQKCLSCACATEPQRMWLCLHARRPHPTVGGPHRRLLRAYERTRNCCISERDSGFSQSDVDSHTPLPRGSCNEGTISRFGPAVCELLLGTDAVDVVVKSDRGPRGLHRCRNRKQRRRGRAANGRDIAGSSFLSGVGRGLSRHLS